jgi:hypothetical protein
VKASAPRFFRPPWVRALLLSCAPSSTVAAQGIITTLAGTEWGFQGHERLGTGEPLGLLGGAAEDRDGNILLADLYNHVILKLDEPGFIWVVGSGLVGDHREGAPARVVNEVKVTIGGLEAQVQFAGSTPGLAGLYQVNAVVSQGVTPGNEVPVVLTVAGQQSPPVTMAVK